jgi:hypothetical protein
MRSAGSRRRVPRAGRALSSAVTAAGSSAAARAYSPAIVVGTALGMLRPPESGTATGAPPFGVIAPGSRPGRIG